MDWRYGWLIVLVLAVTAIGWLVLRRLLFRSGVPVQSAKGTAARLISLQAAAAFVGFWAAVFLSDSILHALHARLYSETDAAYALLSAYAAAVLMPPLAGMVYVRRKVSGAAWLRCFQISVCLPVLWWTVLLVFSLFFPT